MLRAALAVWLLGHRFSAGRTLHPRQALRSSVIRAQWHPPVRHRSTDFTSGLRPKEGSHVVRRSLEIRNLDRPRRRAPRARRQEPLAGVAQEQSAGHRGLCPAGRHLLARTSHRLEAAEPGPVAGHGGSSGRRLVRRAPGARIDLRRMSGRPRAQAPGVRLLPHARRRRVCDLSSGARASQGRAAAAQLRYGRGHRSDSPAREQQPQHAAPEGRAVCHGHERRQGGYRSERRAGRADERNGHGQRRNPLRPDAHGASFLARRRHAGLCLQVRRRRCATR